MDVVHVIHVIHNWSVVYSMIYAYYGDGQGKTSSINGMILRAFSQTNNILVIRFFKSEKEETSLVS